MTGTMRTIGRLAAAAAVAWMLIGFGAPAPRASAADGDDWESVELFEFLCDGAGGTFIEGMGYTICLYDDGSSTICDAQGKNCEDYPPIPPEATIQPKVKVDPAVLRRATPALQAPANAAPAAADDAYRVTEGRALKREAAKGVLANDADPDGDPLTARLVEGPAKGTLKLNPDGSFVYKPKRGFHGTDRFVYEASDGKGGTATATVTIKVVARPN